MERQTIEQSEEEAKHWAGIVAILYKELRDKDIPSDHVIRIVEEWIHVTGCNCD